MDFFQRNSKKFKKILHFDYSGGILWLLVYMGIFLIDFFDWKKCPGNRFQENIMRIFSFSPFGYEGSLVSVEVDLRRGIPAVDLVGLADGAVKESRERMRSAIRNSGFDFPPERVLISLSPADLKKEGAGFDLAIALSVLAEKKRLDTMERDSDEGTDFPPPDDDGQISGDSSILVMGELELNGRVRPVRGVHAAVSTAMESGIRLCIVPSGNAQEAREIRGMRVFGAENLTDAFMALDNEESFSSGESDETDGNSGRNFGIPEGSVDIGGVLFARKDSSFDFSDVRNQGDLIRGLQVAAAGGHNLLAFGPPGCGKTLSMQRFGELLPLLTLEEAQSVTRIYSIAGLLNPGLPIVRVAPFRQPHQTASLEGMCGGGVHCSPGEISLAHNGVLFLDEAAEFKSSVLQMLRVPLESASVTLSRAGRSTVYPASFQLLVAMNPCPCGFFGSRDKICLCSAKSVEQYWRKISGPLLDRIDIRIQVDANSEKNDRGGNPSAKGKSTDELRREIAVAVLAQRKRQGKKNARLNPMEIKEFCPMDQSSNSILSASSDRYGFSPRAVSECIKLARTVADMAGKDMIDGSCMEEAVSLRKNNGGMDLDLQ